MLFAYRSHQARRDEPGHAHNRLKGEVAHDASADTQAVSNVVTEPGVPCSLCSGGCRGSGSAGAKVEKLAGDFKFTEGPARDREGNIYFTDIPNAHIHKWSLEGKLSVFRENSGGANGLYFDASGHLLACEGVNRRVTAIAPDGEVTVLAERYAGKRLNSPNDLWIDPKGGVYFSDPRYGDEQGIEQDGFDVYYLPPGRKPLQRVLDNLVKPNGVVGTHDGKLLYVADAGDGKTYVCRIEPDGGLTDRKLAAPVGADGMTLDENGNLYLAQRCARLQIRRHKAHRDPGSGSAVQCVFRRREPPHPVHYRPHRTLRPPHERPWPVISTTETPGNRVSLTFLRLLCGTSTKRFFSLFV